MHTAPTWHRAHWRSPAGFAGRPRGCRGLSIPSPGVRCQRPPPTSSSSSESRASGGALLSLYLQARALFLATGPHRWYWALACMWPWSRPPLDCAPRFERRQPAAALPAWPFDALVYLLAALQIALVAWTVVLFTRQGIFSFDMILVLVLVGGSSGFSIITAHELIHRKGRAEQALGRFLLCSVLYEHFYTEHLRGHHVRVGTPEDPATAASARASRRSSPHAAGPVRARGSSRSAAWATPTWGSSTGACSEPDPPRLALEWGVALAVLAVFGLASFVAFVLQAFMAVRLLEAVNYFEHWGLVRRGPRVKPSDSWDTHSWFTYYGLVGLSRHADHHAWPARPYQQLRVFDDAPLLPMGYVGMVDFVMADNPAYQRSRPRSSPPAARPLRRRHRGARRRAPRIRRGARAARRGPCDRGARRGRRVPSPTAGGRSPRPSEGSRSPARSSS